MVMEGHKPFAIPGRKRAVTNAIGKK